MHAYPLLDLESAWKDAQERLREIAQRAETLWVESAYTWLDMLRIRCHADLVRARLGELPPDVRTGIAKDWADLEDAEAHAPENIHGF